MSNGQIGSPTICIRVRRVRLLESSAESCVLPCQMIDCFEQAFPLSILSLCVTCEYTVVATISAEIMGQYCMCIEIEGDKQPERKSSEVTCLCLSSPAAIPETPGDQQSDNDDTSAGPNPVSQFPLRQQEIEMFIGSKVRVQRRGDFLGQQLRCTNNVPQSFLKSGRLGRRNVRGKGCLTVSKSRHSWGI